MIEISIPRFGPGGRPASGKITMARIVTDYAGTLSCGRKLTPGVEDRLRKLKGMVDIHVVSTHLTGSANSQ